MPICKEMRTIIGREVIAKTSRDQAFGDEELLQRTHALNLLRSAGNEHLKRCEMCTWVYAEVA